MTACNRLAQETSPYLLQHARNPVDWYPWGPEALERARREERPIFLSIGYAACHWCHVMAHESFENPAVAEILNRHFVAIKVDREERPDLDEVYMAAAQALTGSGGWPLSVFLTPNDLRPFYAGTYFPPESRYGLPGFGALLLELARLWRVRRDALVENAAQLAAALRQALGPRADEAGGANVIDARLVDRAVDELAESFDPEYGGFGLAPKFPPIAALDLLLRVAARGGGAMPLVTRTLDAMAHGGMCDHLGGGFHRYATDARWLVPHFEKMLYDQAQFARLYCDAWRATGNPEYARVARETLDYIVRDLADAEGGFHSSEDADSPASSDNGHGGEGLFYTWTPAEVRAALADAPAEAEAFLARYGVTDAGNFEGRSIPNRINEMAWASSSCSPPPSARGARGPGTPPAGDARDGNASSPPAGGSLDAGPDSPSAGDTRAGSPCHLERPCYLERLRLAREARPRPARDDKVLAAWNGLAISALARAGSAMGEPRYLAAAAHAARFVLARMVRADGRLLRSWRAGAARQPAFLDDYAEMGRALLDLFEADGSPGWLRAAERLAHEVVRLFAGEAAGGFFYVASDAPEGELLVRTQPFADGPVPPGNVAAADLLLRLGHWLGDDALSGSGRRTLDVAAAQAARAPRAFLYLLGVARDRLFAPPCEVVVAGPAADPATTALLAEARRRYLPGWTLLALDPAAPGAAECVQRVAPLAGRTMRGGRPTAYVCRGGACREPVTTVEALAAQLDEAHG